MIRPKLYASNRQEWRAWLKENHKRAKEIWLVYYKKHTGKPSVGYRESVEEALCFGWVDGIKKRIDDETYTHRFSPRKTNSRWSPLNIKLAEKMIAEGKMTKAGLHLFKHRVNYDKKTLEFSSAKKIPLTPELEKALRANSKAWQNFQNLAPSYKKQYVGWLLSAKKEETKQKRLEEAIGLLIKNQKLGMR